MKRISHIFILAALISLTNGCSSTIQEKERAPISDIVKNFHGEPIVPREANKIHIIPRSYSGDISGVSERFLLMLKNKISMDGRLAIVPESGGADILLQYSINLYQVQAVKYGDMGRPVRKRMRIVAGIQLIDAVKNRVILADREIQSFREFSEIIPPVENEMYVLNIVLDNLTSRVFSKTVTGWYTNHMTKIEKGKK